VPRYLADTSAWHWSGRVAERWNTLLEDDEIAMCTPIALELLVSARGPADYASLARDLRGLSWVAFDETAEIAAREMQTALARRNQHRGVTPVDIMVAAVANANGLVLLHYDRHFELIGRVTRQPTEWLARRGSLN
jgi:predicted nucleic acid-binding protein